MGLLQGRQGTGVGRREKTRGWGSRRTEKFRRDPGSPELESIGAPFGWDTGNEKAAPPGLDGSRLLWYGMGDLRAAPIGVETALCRCCGHRRGRFCLERCNSKYTPKGAVCQTRPDGGPAICSPLLRSPAPPLPRPPLPRPSAPLPLCPPAPPLPCSSAPCALLPCDCMAILPPIPRRVKSASVRALMRCVWAEKADCRGIGHRAGGGNVSAQVRGGEAEEGLPVFLGVRAPISAASASRSAQRAERSAGVAEEGRAGTRWAMTRPRRVMATVSPPSQHKGHKGLTKNTKG